MKTYRITALLMLVLLSSTIVSPAHAHPSSQSSILESTQINQGMYSGYYVGGPRVGCNLNEGYHIGGQTIRYESKQISGVECTMVYAAAWNYISFVIENESYLISGGVEMNVLEAIAASILASK